MCVCFFSCLVGCVFRRVLFLSVKFCCHSLHSTPFLLLLCCEFAGFGFVLLRWFWSLLGSLFCCLGFEVCCYIWANERDGLKRKEERRNGLSWLLNIMVFVHFFFMWKFS